MTRLPFSLEVSARSGKEAAMSHSGDQLHATMQCLSVGVIK